ncbi:hypothetical protein GGQ86_003008 [Xanthobacter flavus]|uniref:HTH cro/C1-type domain-containing protein n=1 Tax=Xanthobacter flavus TaxID=281 RepID=A0A9W6CP12_XANFL|nr:S24 family peptidase [Xanthobacter flavus]MDR6334526.1 hypothetical protein [Xanthobacter flavus]GLI23457.1 hypothetical protein XFLAVUS301_31310 [Xanthobacter flavus]
MASLKEIVEKRLAQTGRKPVPAATGAGLERNFINDILTGKKTSIRQASLIKLAAALDMSAPELGAQLAGDPESSLGHSTVSAVTWGGPTIPVAGVVEAGAFREADDSNQDEPELVPAEPDKRWPEARQVAFRVAGDSMNALKPVPILEGATLICVDYEDIADRHPLRSGMIAVVERAALGGQMREWSVKQLEVLDDRFVFHPRSTSQKHKPIVVTTDFEADDGMTVSVLALVRRIDNPVID